VSPIIVFLATFVSVFALGLQSLNVNQGLYLPAAVTSFFISTGHIFLYEIMPHPTGLDRVGYYTGAIAGITASIWFHKRARAWLPALLQQARAWWLNRIWFRRRSFKRDEHADPRDCGYCPRHTDVH